MASGFGKAYAQTGRRGENPKQYLITEIQMTKSLFLANSITDYRAENKKNLAQTLVF
jgi:hypothetical protein